MSETTFVDPNHRQMGIATDDSNHNFAGARDPDTALFVQFYSAPTPNSFLTLKEGRPIFEDRLRVRIEIPGNRNSIVDRFAYEEDKQRFHRQWALFQSKHADDGTMVGTPLSQWSLLAPARVEELKALGFRNVEQVASASDDNITRIGMAAGIAPFVFRDRAKIYLQAAAGTADAQKTADENKALREAVESEKTAREEMHAKHEKEMQEMRALIAQATSQPKRGRPRKDAAA